MDDFGDFGSGCVGYAWIFFGPGLSCGGAGRMEIDPKPMANESQQLDLMDVDLLVNQSCPVYESEAIVLLVQLV